MIHSSQLDFHLLKWFVSSINLQLVCGLRGGRSGPLISGSVTEPISVGCGEVVKDSRTTGT